MSTYLRSVLFRVAGAFAGISLWVGLIVLAVVNFETPADFGEGLGATWLFWVVSLGIAGGVFLVRRRLGPGPGWGAFFIGLMAPFVGLFLNAGIGSGGGLWFWLPVLALIFVPLATWRTNQSAEGA